MTTALEQYEASKERLENQRLQVVLWLQDHTLSLAEGMDYADMTEGSVRGATFFFDVVHKGRYVGGGHVFWCEGRGGKLFRTLCWRLNTDEHGETHDLGEELWRRAKLDRQLPPEFRLGFRSHTPEFIQRLRAEACEEEMGEIA